MENLVSRAAYDVDETGYWARMPLVLGIVMSVVGVIIIWATVGRHSGVREIIIRGLAGGGLFAMLFPVLFRWSTNAAVSRTYAGIGKFAAAPPPGLDLTYRLPCSLLKTAVVAIGGALYLGESGLVFVPHEANPPSRRQPLVFALGDLRTVAVVGATPWFFRPLVPRPPTLLEVSGGAVSARFVVPAPMATIPKIITVIESLRA